MNRPEDGRQPNAPDLHRHGVKGSGFPQLIGLHGALGAGKATVAAHLCDVHGFRHYSLADPARAALTDLDPLLNAQVSLAPLLAEHGWPGALTHRIHGPEVTRLFTQFDTTARTLFGPLVWIDQLVERATADMDLMGVAPEVLTDVTTDVEAAWVLEQGGAIWSVQRPGHAEAHPLPDDLITAVIKNHATVLALTRRVDRAVGETPAHLTAVMA